MFKKVFLLLMILFVILSAVSCSPGGKGEFFEDQPIEEEHLPDETGDRKIIITAVYDIDVKDIPEAVKAFNEQVTAVGGYVQKSGISSGSASYIFRIPADKLDEFLSFTENTGKVTYSSRKGEDVTIEYHDIQAELRALRIQEERLLALLEFADSLDNILAIEKQLGDIRVSIEKITTRMNELDNLVDYATVYVYLFKEKPKTSFGALLAKSFKASIRFGIGCFKYLTATLVFLSPYILFVAAVAIVIRIIRKIKKKNLEKKNS